MDKLSQEQQEMLNNLRWEYDKDLPYVPWEYSIIKWNKDKTKELEEIWNTIYNSAENYIVLEDEPLECFSCIKIGDYYYGVSEKDEGICIGRTYTNSHKLKTIYNFMQSKKYKYEKGMSLSDIYNRTFEIKEELIKTIEKYLCCYEIGGYSIYELLQKILIFEICYETINKKILEKKTEQTILESNIVKNMFLVGHTYTQINILGKLFDPDKRTLSFINLWKETKNLLPQDEKYKEINEIFENLEKNNKLKTLKDARDKVVCHNDKDADRNIEIDIRECAIASFKIYNYFNSFIPNKFDFLQLREYSFLNYEAEKLSLPFLKNEDDIEDFKDNYKTVLKDFNLQFMRESDLIKLMEETVKVTVKKVN